MAVYLVEIEYVDGELYSRVCPEITEKAWKLLVSLKPHMKFARITKISWFGLHREIIFLYKKNGGK